MLSSKEKYMISNTLACVPVLLEGHVVRVDLRNDTSVVGRIKNADGFMNLSLVDVVFIDRNGAQYPFEVYVIKERMIRLISMPTDFDLQSELQASLKQRQNKSAYTKKVSSTYKTKRAAVKHMEILKEIKEQKLKKPEQPK